MAAASAACLPICVSNVRAAPTFRARPALDTHLEPGETQARIASDGKFGNYAKVTAEAAL